MNQAEYITLPGSNVIDLGNFTNLIEGSRSISDFDFVDAGTGEGERWYAFTLDEARTVTFELTKQQDNADLYLLDSEGCVIWHSTNGGTPDELRTADELIARVLGAGTYYVRVVGAEDSGFNAYTLSYMTADPLLDWRENIGDITDSPTTFEERDFRIRTVDGPDPSQHTLFVDFEITEHRLVQFYLHRMDSDVEMFLEDQNGNVIRPGEPPVADFGNDSQYHSYVSFGLGAGKYVLRIVARENVEDTLKISWQMGGVQGVSDDYGHDASAAGAIGLVEHEGSYRGEITGRIDLVGDDDWFGVAMQANTVYRITVTGAVPEHPHSIGQGLSNPQIVIFDSEGVEVASFDAGDEDEEIAEFTAGEAGTYYIQVNSENARVGRQYQVGDYTVVVDVVDVEVIDLGDISGSGAHGLTWHPESLGENDGRPNSEDRFKFTVDEATTFTAVFRGLAPPAYIVLRDSDGNVYAEGHQGPNFFIHERLEVLTDPDDYYILSVRTEDGVQRNYNLGYGAVPVDDHGDDAQSATTLDLVPTPTGHEATADGRIGAVHDEDWFAVGGMQAGHAYRITVTGVDLTDLDPRIVIVDSQGNAVRVVDAGTGNAEELEFIPTDSGDYYIRVDSESGTGRYDLRVETDGAAPGGYVEERDLGDITGTTRPARVMEVLGEQIDGQDNTEDRFTFKLTDPKVFLAWLPGLDRADNIVLMDNRGHVYAEGNHGGPTRFYIKEELQPLAGPEDYYVLVVTGADGGRPQPYELIYVVRDPAMSPETLAPGVTSTDGIAEGEAMDVYELDARAGDTYTVVVSGSGPADPLTDVMVFGIRDASGNRVVATVDQDESGNYRIVFTAGATETCEIFIGSESGATGEYAVTVTRDDFTADRTTGAHVDAATDETGELETAGDEDWVAIDVVAGVSYEVDALMNGSGNSVLFGIYDADGSLVHAVDPESDDSGLEFSTASAGRYYVAVGSTASDPTGAYTVTVEETM